MIYLLDMFRSTTCLPPTPVEVSWTLVLVGVILVCTLVVHVVLIVHLLGLLLGLTLGFLTIEPILALCLCLLPVSISLS
jgi:hypothetical protein